MGDLHAFFDKDVLIKLACCDLWPEVIDALGVTHPYRLASATAEGCGTALRRMNIDDALRIATTERLRRIAAEVPVVPESWAAAAATSALFNDMVMTQGIDSGEAQLAVVALRCAHGRKLVSGDKRFVAAMSTAFPDEFERLKPYFVTFERCVLAACQAKGWNAVKGGLLAARGCDGTLAIALGADGRATQAAFTDAMLSFSPV